MIYKIAFNFFFLIIGFVLTTNTLLAQDILRKPYLLKEVLNDGKVDITIRWRADVDDFTLKYGRDIIDTKIAKEDLVLVAKADTAWDYIATLQGLEPSTEADTAWYHYGIFDKKNRLVFPENIDSNFCFFKTRAKEKENQLLNVWILGDSGKGGDPNLSRPGRVKNAIFADYGYLKARDMQAKDMDFMIMLGDNAYRKGRDFEMQDGIFDMYEEQLHHLPLWPCLGNHETDYYDDDFGTGDTFYRYYFEAFNLPLNGVTDNHKKEVHRAAPGSYYSYNYGNAHFVCLDSNFKSALYVEDDSLYIEDQIAWLKKDLETHAHQYKWLIAYWHNPIYSMHYKHHSHDSSESPVMRNVFAPILEEYGVDLVFYGHNHFYQRSHLLNGVYDTENWHTELRDKHIDKKHFIQKGEPIEDAQDINVIYKNKDSETGAVYIVCGKSGGAGMGHAECHQSIVKLDENCSFEHSDESGSCHLQVSDDSLTVRFITANPDKPEDRGYLIKDAFKIVKE